MVAVAKTLPCVSSKPSPPLWLLIKRQRTSRRGKKIFLRTTLLFKVVEKMEREEDKKLKYMEEFLLII